MVRLHRCSIPPAPAPCSTTSPLPARRDFCRRSNLPTNGLRLHSETAAGSAWRVRRVAVVAARRGRRPRSVRLGLVGRRARDHAFVPEEVLFGPVGVVEELIHVERGGAGVHGRDPQPCRSPIADAGHEDGMIAGVLVVEEYRAGPAAPSCANSRVAAGVSGAAAREWIRPWGTSVQPLALSRGRLCLCVLRLRGGVSVRSASMSERCSRVWGP